jgi:predicted DCC family thiol-disulfide oxidoreductase YuxK
MSSEVSGKSESWLLYDGDCPFCSSYIKLMKIREHYPDFELINARAKSSQLDEAKRLDYNLNEGMLIKLDETYYYGSEAISIINNISTLQQQRGIFFKIHKILFSRRAVTKVLYRIMRIGRLITLKLLGKKPLDN